MKGFRNTAFIKSAQVVVITFFVLVCDAQPQPQTFYGTPVNKDYSVCPDKKANAFSEQQVENMITAMLDKIGITNSFIIIDCPQVANCQATVWTDGKPYILYNAVFLDKVKRLNFAAADLPDIGAGDWETLTLLAHELGHLVNNHFTNPKPGTRAWDWELEADKFAGFMIYMLKGKLSDALSVYNDPIISENGTYTHPGRKDRKKAVETGWKDAEKKYPGTKPNPGNTDKPVIQTNSNEWTPISDIDGNIYKTIKIGDQLWMQSNLNVSHFKNGDIIPEVKNDKEWFETSKQKKPAWCYYNNDPAHADIYGKMYNWYAVNDPRGLAPEGWHVASEIEWSRLINGVGGDNSAGGRLKSTQYWKSPNTDATDAVGFYALPGGSRATFGYSFGMLQEYGRWWTSTIDEDQLNAWDIFMYHNKKSIEKDKNSPGDGASVRCIKD